MVFHSRRQLFPALLILLGLLWPLAVSFCAESEPQGGIVFTFNPPNCTATQTFKTTKIKNLGVQGKQTDVGTGKVKIEYAKTSKGYTITHTPISIETTRNGKPLGNDSSAAVQKLLQNAVLTYQINPNGQLVSILGFDKLIDDMLAMFSKADPAAGQKMAVMLPKIKEAAIAKEMSEWNGKIGSFVDQGTDIGDIWEVEGPVEMPLIGSYAAKTQIEMAGIVEIGGRKCLKMVYKSKPDPKTLTAGMNKMFKEIVKSSGSSQPAPKIDNAKIVVNGTVIIDPSTMLIYQEKFDRTSSITMQTPEQGKTDLSVTETKESSYSYSQ